MTVQLIGNAIQTQCELNTPEHSAYRYFTATKSVFNELHTTNVCV